MSLDILKQELKKGILRKIYLIYGEEEYLKRLYAKRIENIAIGGALSDINKFVLCEPKDVSQIEDLCETLPYFSDKKFILVKNSGYFKSTKKEKKTLKDNVYQIVSNMPEHVCMVFLEADIDKRLKLVKTIEKNGLVLEVKTQSQGVLLEWIVSEMKKRGKNVHPSVALKIIQYCNFSMSVISNEMDKLEFYTEDREVITDNDVDAVCVKDINVRIFDLLDNIATRKVDSALENLRDMIVLREPIPRIMFMISRHFTQLLDMKILLTEGGLTVRDCISAMNIAPYSASKLAQQVNNFEVSFLKKMLKKILDLDYRIKVGNIKGVLAVQLIIIELCRT